MHIITNAAQLKDIPAKHAWVAYDIETTGLDPRKGEILLISLTTPDDTYVIDCTRIDKKDINILAPVLTQNIILGANIIFDYKWTLHHYGIELGHTIVDVMVNEMILTAGLFVRSFNGKPFSLQAITERRLGRKLNKDVRDEFIHYTGTLTDAAFAYAGEDTEVLYPIWQQQLLEFDLHSMRPIYELECQLLPVTAYMEYTGTPLDIDALKKLEAPFRRYVEACERMFQDIFISKGAAQWVVFGDTYSCLNITSKDQVKQAFQSLGMDITSLAKKELVKWDFKNRKRKDEVSFQQLLDLEDEDIADAIDNFGGYENPYLRAYSFFVGADKLLSSYVLGLAKKYDETTKRFYPWFRQVGARSTGRYSSDAQQIPKNEKLKRLGIDESIRECIVAPKGRKIIIADFSAIELIILADQSGDERLAFENSRGDLHLVVTKEVLGYFFPVAKEITKENKGTHPFKTLRDFSKTFSYGIAYGVTGKSISEQATVMLGAINLKMTAEQGDKGIELWKKAFPQAGKYLDVSALMAVTKGYTDSILGRKRFYDMESIRSNKWKYLAAKREGSNQRIQSTSADMTKLAMIKCFERLDRRKARIILSIHDEIVLESSTSYAETAAQILKESMEKAAQELLPVLGHTVIVHPAISERYDK
jgi:DNA polymerase-1